MKAAQQYPADPAGLLRGSGACVQRAHEAQAASASTAKTASRKAAARATVRGRRNELRRHFERREVAMPTRRIRHGPNASATRSSVQVGHLGADLRRRRLLDGIAARCISHRNAPMEWANTRVAKALPAKATRAATSSSRRARESASENSACSNLYRFALMSERLTQASFCGLGGRGKGGGLHSAARATLSANWMGSVNERKRELSARREPSTAGAGDAALARAFSPPSAESRNARKPLRILAETNEPRKIALPGFSVNSSVASFRDRSLSSPSRTRTYNNPVNSRVLYH